MHIVDILIVSLLVLVAGWCVVAFGQNSLVGGVREKSAGVGDAIKLIKDLRSMKAGCVIPKDVHPEIMKLVEYLKANGVKWTGYVHNKDRLPEESVDWVYLRNVTGKDELDALDVRLEKSEALARLWLTPQDKPASEQEDIWAVNGCLAVDIQFIGEEASRIKKLVEAYKK